MAAIRRNIHNRNVNDQFLDGLVALDTTMSGVTTSQVADMVSKLAPNLAFDGIDQEFSYYDLLVLWHVTAMSIPTGGLGQNAAHGGPIFLPWHRHYMLVLEQWLQNVLDDKEFGLPYWDWATDGGLQTMDQSQTDLWTSTILGEARGEVVSGRVGQMRVRLWENPMTGTLESIEPRSIRRQAGENQLGNGVFSSLPTRASVDVALQEPEYDVPDWGQAVVAHRARLEGWVPSSTGLLVDLHNLVHVWIGGDMSPGTSPNDPVFFLNHCNVDRIWEAWQADKGRVYSPPSGTGPHRHQIDSEMFTLIGTPRKPEDVLDPSAWYSYDSLEVS